MDYKKNHSVMQFYIALILAMINGAGGDYASSNQIKKEQYELKNNTNIVSIYFKFLIILRFRKYLISYQSSKINHKNQLIHIKLDTNNLRRKSDFFNLYDIAKINLCLIYNQLNEFGDLKP